MLNTGNKLFYLICGERLAQNFQKYANNDILCIMLVILGPTLG